MREIYGFLRLANPFAVRKFWFCKLALTCVDLRVRLARAKTNPKRKQPQEKTKLNHKKDKKDKKEREKK